ncbi:hypothetical protein VaNZ11_012764 [Volvox africanus]|uniref:3'-5' exonuclease domain-containing protein n=1 Tax=Volvox africanus TaxID=51714 RepID=A0ABQ5SGQ2_9CHLO|nr:hypothetical protein VaNZ11_012764 [Volvox africanus]
MPCAVADSETSLEPAAAVNADAGASALELLQPSHSGSSAGVYGIVTEFPYSYEQASTAAAAAPMSVGLDAPPANGFTTAADNGLDRAGVWERGKKARPGSIQAYGDVGGGAVPRTDVVQLGNVTSADEGGVAWGADEAASGSGTAQGPQQSLTTEVTVMRDHASNANDSHKSVTGHPTPLAAPRLRGFAAPPSSLTSELSAAVLAVAFPGDSVTARLRRGLVEMLVGRLRPVPLAELGTLLARHPDLGKLWNLPAYRLPKLRDFIESTAALAPRALILDRGDSSVWVVCDPEALRLAALRRAVAAAYPGDDDVSLVRRAAAAALVDTESPVMGLRHSLHMPSLGVCVVQMACEPRQRLAEARGTAFSLASVLQGPRSADPSQATAATAGNGVPRGEENGAEEGYIFLSSVGPCRVARLDADRLLLDAAAGRLGDLTAVQPVKPKASVAGSSFRAPSPPADGTAPATLIVPRVKEVLRAAIPEGRPEMHAKRCIALLAAASLGGTRGPSGPSDPPHTLRSSPCGIVLGDLGLKPPKGQMRMLFDDEPHVFRAGKPSPSYLIELVYEPLLELSISHPEDLAASVAALLQGRTYLGLRFRAPGRHGLYSFETATAAAASAAICSTTAPAALAPSAPSSRFGAAASASRPAAPRPSPPPGQPPDYYQRLEKAMLERLEGSSASEFLTRARHILAMALLRRTGSHGGPSGASDGIPRHAMSVKEAATVLKTHMPEAYQDQRPPGVFPVKVQLLAEQMPLLFTMMIPSGNPKAWYIRLNVDSLELSAGLNPKLVTQLEDAAESTEGDEGEYLEEPHGGDANDLHAMPAIAAARAVELEPLPPLAAAVAEVPAMQPARALAAALAPMAPPEFLPDPCVQIITMPYSHEHVTALSHCQSCSQIGLAAKRVGGAPSIVLLYAPAVDTLKPAAASAVNGGASASPVPTGILPATVYVLDASGAAAAAAAATGSGSSGGGSDAGVALLVSLRVLLEDSGVAKVVHGCEQLIPMLEHAVGCVISPMLDTRLVSEMLKPLDLHPRLPMAQDGPPQPDDGRAPELWPQSSHWQTALSLKYQDYHMAVLHHASGADSMWLTRPFNEGQVGLLVRAVQHLPELWSALTWLLPRLAQFCSIARAQQCRAILGSAASW